MTTEQLAPLMLDYPETNSMDTLKTCQTLQTLSGHTPNSTQTIKSHTLTSLESV